MHYFVITGGPLTSEASEIINNGNIIVADAGIDYCIKHGITPLLAVGDMDSVSPSGLEHISRSGIPVKTYPIEKDMTDTEIALSFVPADSSITVVCPLNGRLDHIIANLQLAGSIHSRGTDIELNDGITQVRFLSGTETATFDLNRWGDNSSVSLIPLNSTDPVSGVSTEGLYYPLSNAQIEFGKTVSFSNKPVPDAKSFKVSIKNGLLAVIIGKAD